MITESDIATLSRDLALSSVDPSRLVPIAKEYVHKKTDEHVAISLIRPVDAARCSVSIPDACRVSFAYAHFNLRCSVCFDHRLDHYPLMAVFEMGRQMGIAATHVIHDLPQTGFVGIAEELSFRFKRFAELDLPLAIVAVDDSIKNRPGHLHQRASTYYFVQGDVVCATGSGKLSFIKSDVYRQLRFQNRAEILRAEETSPQARQLLTNEDLYPMHERRSV